MFTWFRKNKPSEVSAGGSVITRYRKLAEPRIGSPDAPVEEFAQARQAVYDRFFGDAAEVSHEVVPLIPHIDVFIHPPGARDRDFYTLVTGGMSDLAMKLPREAEDAARRVELIFYCSEPKPEYIATLRWLAHFPHDQKSSFGEGHTLPNGNPQAPLWGSAVLDTILFMPTIVSPDGAVEEELQLAGDPIHFLWVVPLTTAECELKLKKGFNAILELFGEHRHPHVFDPNRKSYV